MARKSVPTAPKPASISFEQMKAAMPKLQRRVSELESIDVERIDRRDDPRLDAITQKIDDTLVDIFGTDSIEYRRYRISSLDNAPIYMNRQTPLPEVRDGFRKGIEQATSNLTTIIELFGEKLSDLGETEGGRATIAFEGMDVHPEISRAVEKLFKDGHYANAVEDACKVVDGLVKIRSGRHDLSGTDLMMTAFSVKQPVLKFNELSTESDRSEQQGMMHLFAGAMLALRNPRAHQIMQDDPEQALEYIAFLSLLAKSLDRAVK